MNKFVIGMLLAIGAIALAAWLKKPSEKCVIDEDDDDTVDPYLYDFSNDDIDIDIDSDTDTETIINNN